MKNGVFLLCVVVAACGRDTSSRNVPMPAALPEWSEAPVKSDSAVMAGPMGKSITRGRAILISTRDSLPENALSKLSCANCHLDAGTRKTGLTLVGVYGRYPQYRARSAGVGTLEARINDCFQRSLNGNAISYSSSAMTDLVAYMWFLSRGLPVDGHVAGEGTKKLSVSSGDSVRGLQVFAANCTTCHGSKGEGTSVAPPLWGPNSYNIGAGMARVRTAGGFIRYNMPYDRPGTLTDQQAMDVAAYINSRPRPDFAGKENDWPNADPPPDNPYVVKSVKAKKSGPISRDSISGIAAGIESSGKTSCIPDGRWAICSIEKRMRQSGFVAKKINSGVARRAGFSVNPVGYTLNKSRLELYLYKDAVTLQRDLAKLDTVRVVPRGSAPSSEPPPVLIHSGNLAALLYTDDATQAERLALAITAGAPQAGSSR